MLLLLISAVVVVVAAVVVVVALNIWGNIDPKIWKFRINLVLDIKIYVAKA
jgi:hypothetical protein